MKRQKFNELILLCGYPRSGTTWLSKILDACPDTFLVSEPDKKSNEHLEMSRLPHCIAPEDDDFKIQYRNAVDELLRFLDYNTRSLPFFNKEYLSIPFSLYFLILLLFKSTNVLTTSFFNHAIKSPLFINKEKRVNLIWKSVNQSSNLDFLCKAFPEIKIIYILRNPFASLTSAIKKKSMGLDGHQYMRIMQRQSSPYFRYNDLDKTALTQLNELQLKALSWRIECESAMISGKNKKNFYPIVYERLVSSPFNEINLLFEWLGWSFSDSVKLFIKQSTGREKIEWYNQIFASGYFGVYRSGGININKWYDRITQDECKYIFDVIKDSPLLKFWDLAFLTDHIADKNSR